jgi:integrase
MAKDLLTPTKIANMKKTTAVGGGLSVIVRGKSKSYAFRGTLNHKQIAMHLESVKKMTPAEALRERERCNELIRKGTDPRADKAKRKLQKRSGPAPTVADMLDQYFKKKIEPKRRHDTDANRHDRIKKTMRYLEQICAAIGKVSAADVETEMLTKKLNIEELSSSADELRLHLRRAFAYAEALGWRKGCDPANPASKEILTALLPDEYRERGHRDSLSYTDAPRFVAAVKARKNEGLGKKGRELVPTAPLLFLVYTGVRTNEVRQARWSEIDLERLLWNVPRDHRKKGYTKRNIRAVPISRPMLEVLTGQKKKYDGKPQDDDLIFPGGDRNGGVGRGVINSFIKNTLKWEIQITVHGFRATLNNWAKAQRPRYDDLFIKAQFDHLGKKSEDDEAWLRASMADKHYSHGDVDPTIEGPRARREMVEHYGEYLTSHKDCTDEQH